MKNFLKNIKAPLFKNMTQSDLEEMQALSCMRRRVFDKNALIFQMGSVVHEIGIVTKGSVNIEMVDLWGNKSILNNVAAGQVFAETYALSHQPMRVDAVAAESCEILFLDMDIALDERNSAYAWHGKMLKNILGIFIQKNQALSERIFCTTSKSIRGRVLTYLSAQGLQAGSETFEIPFDRQQMADYLNLDRSALSKELGKMRDEGLIEFRKNRFTIRHVE